jgi:hypothetical protein
MQGEGGEMTKILIIPDWCKAIYPNMKNKDHWRCCKCGGKKIYYQEGDGKFLHSLCKKCHIETHKGKVEESADTHIRPMQENYTDESKGCGNLYSEGLIGNLICKEGWLCPECRAKEGK